MNTLRDESGVISRDRDIVYVLNGSAYKERSENIG